MFYAEFKGDKICVNGKRSRNFVLKLYFKEFCKCHVEKNLNCECILDRER